MRKRFSLSILAALLVITLLLPASAATLAWGSTGDQVRQVQQKLIQYGYMTGSADSVFGRATYDAVIWFQQKNGLTIDGRVGPATAAALGLTLTSGTLSAGNYQSTELELLARLVNGEARGEPYLGKYPAECLKFLEFMAQTEVAQMYTDLEGSPNTISGVIFQTGAFDAVWDGQFDLEPSDSCIRAARDAMNGWDPTDGCIYYYNPSTATNAWIWSRPVQLSIGRHAFAL